MSRQPLRGARVIAIVRLDRPADLVRIGTTLAEAGLVAVEFTIGTPGALSALPLVRRSAGEHCLIGVGSVRTPADVAAAREADAQFLVTPTTRTDVLAHAADAALPVVCGALTPTEIDFAWSAGAECVKVFPAGLGGPGYIREVLAPLAGVPVAPTGGVTAPIIAEYAAAGAVAVGVGSALVSRDIVECEDWVELGRRAKTFVEAAAAAWPV